MTGLFSLLRPALHCLDAETAHGLSIKALKSGLIPNNPPVSDPCLAVLLWGQKLSNPIGLAAGFDKNAEVCAAMLAQGFGFVEAGTLTPRPQAGNPRPRLFRLAEDEAVINRMGFNNQGHEAARQRLKGRQYAGIVGINIGANKDSEDRIEDYIKGVKAFHDCADYLTINISSPNTPGLRGLQSRDELHELLQRINEARSSLASTTPLVLKIAPDLIDEELDDISEVCLAMHKADGLDGMIVSNTTIARPPLSSIHKQQAGGLSGQPLFEPATRILAKVRYRLGGALPLIGAGGIGSADQAWQKITAGAKAIQLYSALVYQGPALVSDICQGLVARCRQHGYKSISEASGTAMKDWL